MVRVSSAEFSKQSRRYQDVALVQPVIVTRDGHDRTVMISMAEYHRLQKRYREVLGIEDFGAEDIAAIRRAEPSQEADSFNHEMAS